MVELNKIIWVLDYAVPAIQAVLAITVVTLLLYTAKLVKRGNETQT
jgi:hypothetical protein